MFNFNFSTYYFVLKQTIIPQDDFIIQDNPKSTVIYHSSKAEKTQNWPKNRDIKEIEGLLREFIFNKFSLLPKGARILDVGCGNGKFMREIDITYPRQKFILSAITTTEVMPENIHHFDDITYAYVPDLEWLARNAGSCDLIMDTYASLTYSNNPLHSLLFLALASKEDGELYSMSSMTIDDFENSCFGNSGTREAIKNFFKTYLDVDVEFTLVDIESKACKLGQIMKDLKIAMKVSQEGIKLLPTHKNLSIEKRFQALCALADQEIGIAKKIEKETDFKAGSYAINTRDYVRTDEKKWEVISNTALSANNNKNNLSSDSKDASSNVEILGSSYVEDLQSEKFQAFQRSNAKLLSSIMQKHGWHKSSEYSAHVVALCRLIYRIKMTPEDAEKELENLTPPQARYVARDLTREEVLALSTDDLNRYGKNIPLEALCKFKSYEMTYQDLVWTLPWFKYDEQLDKLEDLIKNQNIKPSMAINKLHAQEDPMELLADGIIASNEHSGPHNDRLGTLLKHFNGPAALKGRPPMWFINECAQRQNKTADELIEEVLGSSDSDDKVSSLSSN